MKQLVAKIVLILAGILLLFVFTFGIAIGFGWPWWVGFFLLIGFAGLFVGLVFLKKVLMKRREQMFVDQIIAQDNTYINSLETSDKDQSIDLQHRWKEAIDALRGSHLKKFGNPLYVLPWYMVIGESGSGKTTSINSARLSSPFAEVSRISGVSGTRNCDWWFFEQAVIIDTAGRYAIPVDEGRDKEEWNSFVKLLVKYRKREPLNGLVISVSADKLLDSGTEALEEDGKNIRRRVDELMAGMGAKFPVYVLVTKCDLIQGMSKFCEQLPEKALDQAMGRINSKLSTDVIGFVERTVRTVGERLRNLRLIFSHKTEAMGQDQIMDPGLLLFPEEFERLKEGLAAFTKGAFKENPYQETPVLRGLFFSSGRQEGTPYSHFLNSLGLIQERDILPGTNKGLFLHDFFSKILPKDRKLYAPTQRSLEWNQLTRNLGLTSWIAVMLAVCGLLSFSFVKNLGILHEVTRDYSKPPVLQGELVTDVVTMDGFRQAIVKVEKRNKGWWIPRFGLNESENVEEKLEQKYCKQFSEGFLDSLDKHMARAMTNFTASTPDDIFGSHIALLVRRINLIRTKLEDDHYEVLLEKPVPSFSPAVIDASQKLIPEMLDRIAGMYIYYLAWESDETKLNKELNGLQTWLKHLLALNGTNLNWLIAWSNSVPELSKVELEEFWGGSLSEIELEIELDQSVNVPAAFTLKGKEHIDSFIVEMESALTDPLMIAGKKTDFLKIYNTEYFRAWQEFGAAFPVGVQRLANKEEWQQVIHKIGTDKGPYFSLMKKMTDALEPFTQDEKLPAWIKLLYEFEFIKIKAKQIESMKEKSGLAKVTSKGNVLLSQLEDKMTKFGSKMESNMVAVNACYDYLKSISEFLPVSESRAVAAKVAAKAFEEDPAVGKSPVFVADRAMNKIKTSMTTSSADQEMFWKLVAGPIDFLFSYVCQETACHLQELWVKEVLVEVEGETDRRRTVQLLLGQGGYARTFLKGPAKPFVNRNLKKGFYAKRAFDKSIPFNEVFFKFLTKGALAAKPLKSSYTVSIKGLPTDVNHNAQVRPHATRIELQCADETLKLVNMNFPVKKTFVWSPNTCGDVNFEIEVGGIVLTKKYSGYQAFPGFLQDFSKGSKVFYRKAFPRYRSDLKRMGIKYIKVKYQFKGHRPVLKLISDLPEAVPEDIAECWG